MLLCRVLFYFNMAKSIKSKQRFLIRKLSFFCLDLSSHKKESNVLLSVSVSLLGSLHEEKITNLIYEEAESIK
jgi:hypothetical protein